MEHFLHILLQPDNIPIVGMLAAVLICLAVALTQAFRHDKFIEEGKRERIVEEMMK